jgi:hypothetical protein
MDRHFSLTSSFELQDPDETSGSGKKGPDQDQQQCSEGRQS